VGDVDFEADAGPTPPQVEATLWGPRTPARAPTSARTRFPSLPGTRREVEVIGDLFREAHPAATMRVLRGAGATEQSVRAALPDSRYVHLATHGFFSRPDRGPPGYGRPSSNTPQGLAEQSPDLYSGVALAGASRPLSASGNDGIVTAFEARQLDLGGVELMVLSACETSLGSDTHGEGLLGLQRAFHIAGVRSMISSLWKVDDTATAELMELLHTNLWRRKLSPVEALRQAQLAILDHPERVARRRWELVDRSLGAKQEELPLAGRSRRRGPPAWWAGFVLSGGLNGLVPISEPRSYP
jgi:CHAT domain-containing protein